MTTVKIATKHRNGQSALFVGMGMAWMGIFSAIMFVESTGLQIAIGVVSAIVLFGTVFAMMRKRELAFICPDCGGPVDAARDTENAPGAPILRLCRSCDVLWQTGVVPD